MSKPKDLLIKPLRISPIAQIGAAVVVAMPLVGAGAAAPALADSGLWNTTRILGYDGNECAGQVSGCRTVASGPVAIAANGAGSITVDCPSLFPRLVGWDTEQNEFLEADLVSPDPDQVAGFGKRDVKPVDSLTVLVTSNADAVGIIQVYIGCARRATNGTPLMSERIGVPSNHVGFTGGEQ